MRMLTTRAARLLGRFALVATLAGMLSACQMTLYENLSQQEANRMVAALIRAGVAAERVASGENGFSVLVDEGDMAQAMAALEREGLPATTFETLGDVFKKEGLLSSPTEERARLVYATSQELSKTISEIDGVLNARIHVVLPEEDARGGADRSASASVFIRHKPDADIEALLPDIKMLVTKSIANLPYDEVSVIRVAAPAEAYAATAPMFESVLGFRVAAADAGMLRLTLSGLAVIALGALAGLGLALRSRSGGAAAGQPGATRLEAVATPPGAGRPPRRAA